MPAMFPASSVDEARDVHPENRVWPLAWAVALATIPLHLLPSGLPQVADVALLAVAVASLLRFGRRIPRAAWKILTPVAAFVAYATAVNGGWAAWLGSADVARFVLYYPFDLVVLGGAVAAYAGLGRRFLRAALIALFAGLAVQAVVVVAGLAYGTLGRPGSRIDLLFNNPNQLGYFALLAGAIVALGARPARLNAWIAPAAIACAGVLVGGSASRAAILGFVVLLVVHAARHPRAHLLAALMGLVAVVPAAAAVGTGAIVGVSIPGIEGQFPWLDSSAADVGEQESDGGIAVTVGSKPGDSLVGRGYDRIWKNPEYLWIGAGEGAYGRFEAGREKVAELHSIWGTLVFSYGIAGTLAFVAFLVGLARAAAWDFLYIVPAGVYGLTHQGLRETLLWVAVAVLIAVAVDSTRRRLGRGSRTLDGGRTNPEGSRSEGART